MSIVESDGPPSWSLDVSETGESTKCLWVEVIGVKSVGWGGPHLPCPPSPLPTGILYSPQFRLHQETKIAPCQTQRSTSPVSRKNRGLWTVYKITVKHKILLRIFKNFKHQLSFFKFKTSLKHLFKVHVYMGWNFHQKNHPRLMFGRIMDWLFYVKEILQNFLFPFIIAMFSTNYLFQQDNDNTRVCQLLLI